MKTKTLKLLMFVIVMFITIFSQAQIVQFGYDDAGNRISREIIELKNTQADSTTNKKPEEYKGLLGETSVIVCPNPNGGEFTINIKGELTEGEVQIFVHSISGKLVFEDKQADAFTNVDLSERENGIYILSIIQADNKKTWKIIKQ